MLAFVSPEIVSVSLVIAVGLGIAGYRWYLGWRRSLRIVQESIGSPAGSPEPAPPAWAEINPACLRWVPDYAVVRFEHGGIGWKTDLRRGGRMLVATRHTHIWYPEDTWVEMIKAPSELARAYVEGAVRGPVLDSPSADANPRPAETPPAVE